ncbi:hypothetical protein KIW84_021966 [Lathyrus oleraceus]|uniref:Uncharacterized protein n=1 Tax=Pisum sativum TaxID=3888 RepID=A0A9D4YD71_PEA|nr:hypothetical protein KIW84_021966 [Pisum sativum]
MCGLMLAGENGELGSMAFTWLWWCNSFGGEMLRDWIRVEFQDDCWKLMDSGEGSDVRGIKEVDLNTSVASTSFTVQLGRNEVENKNAYTRYGDFEKWMRKECLNSSVSCSRKFGKKR